MYIIKNSLVSIMRNKGRNILIGIILIIIAASSAIGLSIKNSAKTIVKSYEEKYKIEATIGINRVTLMDSLRSESKTQEEMIEAFNKIESITEEEIIRYGDSKYISDFYYVYEIAMNATDIKEATDSLVKETTTTTTSTEHKPYGDRDDMPWGGPRGQEVKKTTTTKKTEKIYNEKAMNGAFKVIGYSSYESMKNFINGSYKLSEGSISSDFESLTCLISEELALLNELSVGDKITLTNPNNSKKKYEVEITGIYKENTDESANMSTMFSSSANTIITNSNLVKQIIEDETLPTTITPTFILKNKEYLEDFTEELTAKGLNELYTVSSNIDDVTNATKSITNVESFATTFLVITLLIGGTILFVINMINIRERKYEIGVLRTIGMKKTSVILQFTTELLIVASAALMIGSCIGASTSVNIANNLLKTEITNSEKEYEELQSNFGTKNPNRQDFKNVNGLLNIKQVDTINAVMSPKVLAQLIGIGLLLTIASSLASCIAIARFSPLSILKERS